jgi:heme/copper-type cytochrome/quinol oxidase subunit 3
VPRRAQLGMAMFLIAEAVFFFLLILAFAYFRAMPSMLTPLDGLITAMVLASTVSMWRATEGPRWWLWVTMALGVAFLSGQATFFGTTFFTLVGIHGLHVLGGLIALAVVPSTALRVIALYWYFFTAVWLAIVLVVYVRSMA